jgi:PAS domain S-box-containing protein
MRKYSFLLIFLFFMQLIAPLPAGSIDPIRVGVTQNTPLTFIEDNGKIKGFFIDILEHIAKKEGWDIEYVPSSWPECLSNLKSGKIDLLGGIAYSESRGRNFDYTFESIITNWGQIYLNKKSEIESIIDLKGKKVAVLQNDIFFNNLRKLVDQSGIKCRFIEAFEYEDVLELVEIGRCEAGLVSQIYGLQRERDYDIVKSSILLSPQKLYWAAPKGKNQELLYSLDSFLRELKNNQQSIYHQSLANWFGIGVKPTLGRWFKWIIISFVALLSLFFTASLVLRVQVKSKTKELLIKNEELRESEERFRNVYDTAPLAFVVWDINARVIDWNKKAEALFGWAREEVIDNNFFDFLIPEKDRPRVKDVVNILLKGELQSHSINDNLTKDGRIITCEWNNSPLHDNDGNIIGAISLGLDITERKQVEEEKDKLQTQLQQAHKMEAIGTLAGGIAHDFNNIVGIILGNTELAIDDVPEGNPAQLNLKEVRTASLRAKDVVRQLLSFARKTKLEKKPANIIPIIKESLKFLRSSIPTSIEIRQNIAKDVDTILADPTQINQILINLCANSHHSMPDGGVIVITLKNIELDEDTSDQCSKLNPGRYVNLAVSDTGHGISQEKIDRIFDPYFTTKEVGKGTGMGLAVVHGIVKGHNGLITVESELGKGTTFSIFFPVVEREVVVEAETDEKLPTGSERILFIDDEESLVKIGHQRLEWLGYKVEATISPIEALRLFRSQPDQFDLVITDLTMPKMTGDKLVKKILNIRSDIPIILCTGFSEKIDEKKSKAIGASGYLEKPHNKRDLAKIVRKVLKGKIC